MEDWSKYNLKFRYMMLSRLVMDCRYYLNHGNRSTNILWAKTEADEIANMLALWDTFAEEDKPEWASKEEILVYARQMGVSND